MVNRNLVLSSFLLISLLIASGCGSERAVVVQKADNGAAAEESASQEDCGAEIDTCVAELKDSELTGEYLRIGEVKEGEVFELDFDKSDKFDHVCEEGLIPAAYTKVVDGDCAYTACPCYICVKCPDGTCGEGENKCNCPQDC